MANASASLCPCGLPSPSNASSPFATLAIQPGTVVTNPVLAHVISTGIFVSSLMASPVDQCLESVQRRWGNHALNVLVPDLNIHVAPMNTSRRPVVFHRGPLSKFIGRRSWPPRQARIWD
ncbi:uncharacterized protein BDV14DRAFT_172643, partial [Aspergillus stella-maris]|uniref:uncharacterized protein n=1 Tax=Aspergillus stella-maris TaxID=1810926 RepID=UPI003CCE1596